jgi:ubiquinone/menaquinone biosynthesis C-methylase UbiE
MEGFIATWYAKNTKRDVRGYRATARSVVDRTPAGGKILEVAAGPGYLAIEIAKLGRREIAGVDISKSFVRIATENAREAGVAIEFRQGNAAELPYDDASFDFVVCRAAFKNFADPLGALNEMHRVLKPGGRASVYDLRRDSAPEDVEALVRDMNLSAASAFWTRLTFRHFLLKNAHDRATLEHLAGESRFGGCQIHEHGVEIEVRLAKD